MQPHGPLPPKPGHSVQSPSRPPLPLPSEHLLVPLLISLHPQSWDLGHGFNSAPAAPRCGSLRYLCLPRAPLDAGALQVCGTPRLGNVKSAAPVHPHPTSAVCLRLPPLPQCIPAPTHPCPNAFLPQHTPAPMHHCPNAFLPQCIPAPHILTPVHPCPNAFLPQCLSAPTHCCPNPLLPQSILTPIHSCPNVPLRTPVNSCLNILRPKCIPAPTHPCPNASLLPTHVLLSPHYTPGAPAQLRAHYPPSLPQ